MKSLSPWKKVLLFALLGNGFASLIFYFSNNQLGSFSLIAGSAPPVFLSTILLFIAENLREKTTKRLQGLNVIGFFVKIVFIGPWIVIIDAKAEINITIFILSLLTNFLAWHMVEAYHWPLFLRHDAKA